MWDGANCIIVCEATSHENSNYHANYEDLCLSVCSTFKGLVTAITEE